MMIKYTRYLLLLTAKKVSTYLIPILFLVIFGGMLIGTIKYGVAYTKSSVVANLGTLQYIIPFIFTPLYLVTKGLNIFKEGEKDGTELMIVAKPITRIKVVFSKFLALFIHILLFSLFVFVFSALISIMDSNSSSSQKIRFSASLGFGTFIISLLMASLIVIMVSTFGGVGALVFSMLVPFVFSIMSTILIPLTGAQVHMKETSIAYRAIINDRGEVSYKKEKIYDSSIIDNSNYARENILDDLVKEQHKSSYKTIAYFDVFAQLSSFFNIFQNSNSMHGLNYWRKHSDNFSDNEYLKVKLGKDNKTKKEYVFSFGFSNSKEWGVDLNVIKKQFKDINDHFEDYKKTITDSLNSTLKQNVDNGSLTIDDMEDTISNNYKTMTRQSKMYLIIKWIKEEPNSQLFSNKNFFHYYGDLNQKEKAKYGEFIESDFLIPLDDTLNGKVYYTLEPWVNKAGLYTVWILIAITFSGLVLFKYMNTDFK
ncbi:MAG: ABC transporter permease [Mycoplasma sp.]|nr:ABC transporter permease [Mycoplasma sp.]